MTDQFLSLHDLSVKVGGAQVLENIELTINKGQQWAIFGPTGSGKSVLAHTLMGRHFHSGEIRYHHPIKPAMVEQQHKFNSLTGLAGGLYYQQRFNASDAEGSITVEQELQQYTPPGGADAGWLTGEWLDQLHIRPLLHRPLIQLSNGENKRVQLAIALLEAPDLLILDNPFLGLDVAGRELLHQIINQLAVNGIQLLLITSDRHVPSSITHIARLEQGKLTFCGKKEEFQLPAQDPIRPPLDAAMLIRLKELSAPDGKDFEIAVKMENVSIYYGEKALLKNINWLVKKGERWNVSGPNGAGKSTLLSLITADNPQAYANHIWLFDRRRGSGETIWEIKKNIGFVSPELHLYFDFGASAFDVIASGLFDTIGLFRPISPAQEEQVLLWMKLLSLEGLRTRRLAQLSTGEQRRILLARALIKNPPMLILDEPCQGLDDEQTAWFRELINELCLAFHTTLIYVSHYKQEIPSCVDQFLKLDNGQAVPS